MIYVGYLRLLASRASFCLRNCSSCIFCISSNRFMKPERFIGFRLLAYNFANSFSSSIVKRKKIVCIIVIKVEMK